MSKPSKSRIRNLYDLPNGSSKGVEARPTDDTDMWLAQFLRKDRSERGQRLLKGEGVWSMFGVEERHGVLLL